ncbi:MAG: carboxypeptidase-like regulatory domain-containing protein [Saprospiraceae bacterium]|nr:carboxypeptidase-like regulatory domain-containing protein [Saprospiraceae bacterium]
MYLAHMKTSSQSMIKRFCLVFLLGSSVYASLYAQKGKADEQLVQLSGLILDGATKDLLPVPFATIAVQDKGRGTYADYNGFFSIVVEQGDIVIFTSIGYQPVYFKVPDTLRDNRYSIVQLMTRDTFNLPETVVFPWPSREHLKIEFLAMDVTSDLQKKALENLAQENLNRARQDLSYDGVESASFYMRQQSNAFYHIGQQPPMNIFNPIAWKQFFDAWKRGDFKKKN